MDRGVRDSYNRWLGFGERSIVYKVRMIDVRGGGGRWTSGRHNCDECWLIGYWGYKSLALFLYSRSSSEAFPRSALFCQESSSTE